MNIKPKILIAEDQLIVANGIQAMLTSFKRFDVIKTHRKNIFRKTGVDSSDKLIIWAMNKGLI